jgi:hypothetical protein
MYRQKRAVDHSAGDLGGLARQGHVRGAHGLRH